MRHLRWLSWLLLALLVLTLPWIVFVARDEHRLRVVMIDKTVPFPDRIEHRSLFWLLDRLRVRHDDGRPYDPASDYLGAFPGTPAGAPPARTVDLTPADAERADLLYLVDTYGVYEKDLESGERMEAALERSRKIYGGLTLDEALATRAAVERGTTVVAEFNTFASPTGPEAREAMEQLLGVRWTRWIGRYFSDLDDEREVPPWVRRNYEREWRREWAFRGRGYVLLRDDAHVEVLRVGEESERLGLKLSRTRPVRPLLAGAWDDVPYPYWFDIVRADHASTEVLAEYRWNLTSAGEARLRERGLPLIFPAVTRRVPSATAGGSSPVYYFAGDFADNPLVERRVPLAGYMRLRGWLEAPKLAPSEDAFFWRFYAPMMERLLLDVAASREGRP